MHGSKFGIKTGKTLRKTKITAPSENFRGDLFGDAMVEAQ